MTWRTVWVTAGALAITFATMMPGMFKLAILVAGAVQYPLVGRFVVLVVLGLSR